MLTENNEGTNLFPYRASCSLFYMHMRAIAGWEASKRGQVAKI